MSSLVAGLFFPSQGNYGDRMRCISQAFKNTRWVQTDGGYDAVFGFTHRSASTDLAYVTRMTSFNLDNLLITTTFSVLRE